MISQFTVDPAIIEIVETFGFPAVIALLLYKLATDTIEKNTEKLSELSQVLTELKMEIQKLKNEVE